MSSQSGPCSAHGSATNLYKVWSFGLGGLGFGVQGCEAVLDSWSAGLSYRVHPGIRCLNRMNPKTS